MKSTAKFLTPLEVTPLPDGVNWRLDRDLRFIDTRGDLHKVHAGFVTDFASIPSLARLGAWLVFAGICVAFVSFVPSVIFQSVGCLIAWLDPLLNGDDQLDAPATLHDEGYRRVRYGRRAWLLKFYWDWLLFTAMRANREPLWKCWLIWFNVTVFGWLAWYQDGKKHI